MEPSNDTNNMFADASNDKSRMIVIDGITHENPFFRKKPLIITKTIHTG